MKEENNKMNISRRGFLKTAALAGAALTMPTGLNKVFAAKTKQTAASDNNSDVAHITGHRILGKGKAAFEVSALGFGVMGMTYNRSQHPDKKQCIRLLHEAVDRGVTLFDTAIIYGPLTNENLAGEALAEFKGRINVTTKFGHEVIDGKGTGRQDSRPETIRRYCEESLRRLRLDSLPMFYQHRADPNTPAEEVASTIADLMKEGKVQHWGMCEVNAETIHKAHAVCPLTAIQSEYHLMHRLVEENGVLDACRELGIGFVPYSPLNRGFLGGCINEYTVFDPNNDNRQTLPRFQAEAMRVNTRIAASLRPHARHDLDTSSTRLVATEGTVDRTDSRNNETCTSGGEPAHTGIYTFSRRVERTGKRCCRHSRCRRQIQCRATTAGRSLKQNTLSLAAKTLQVFAFIFASKKQLKITDMKMKVLF